MNDDEYFIVEHAMRGCYVGYEWTYKGTKQVKKYKCRWSIKRTDKAVIQFTNIGDAREIASQIPNSYVLRVRQNPFKIERKN